MLKISGHRSFPRRENAEGSFDSICPRCYRTAATGRRASELEELERIHVCAAEDLLKLVMAVAAEPEDAGRGAFSRQKWAS